MQRQGGVLSRNIRGRGRGSGMDVRSYCCAIYSIEYTSDTAQRTVKSIPSYPFYSTVHYSWLLLSHSHSHAYLHCVSRRNICRQDLRRSTPPSLLPKKKEEGMGRIIVSQLTCYVLCYSTVLQIILYSWCTHDKMIIASHHCTVSHTEQERHTDSVPRREGIRRAQRVWSHRDFWKWPRPPPVRWDRAPCPYTTGTLRYATLVSV